MLELGRGIIANLQLETRSDISILTASHPNIALQFQELRDRIDSPENSTIVNLSYTSDLSSVTDLSKAIDERRALVKQFDDLMQSIRPLKGFENFLRGPSELELRQAAKSNPIVVFNVSDIRSDAIIITADAIRSVHLPVLT